MYACEGGSYRFYRKKYVRYDGSCFHGASVIGVFILFYFFLNVSPNKVQVATGSSAEVTVRGSLHAWRYLFFLSRTVGFAEDRFVEDWTIGGGGLGQFA